MRSNELSEEKLSPIHAAFAEHVRIRPNQAFLVWLDANGKRSSSFDYASFERATRDLAQGLRERGLNPGDVVVLAYAPGLEFYVSFWGCVRAGLVPVPAAPPVSEGSQHAFLQLVRDASAQAVLVDKKVWAALRFTLGKRALKQAAQPLIRYVPSRSSVGSALASEDARELDSLRYLVTPLGAKGDLAWAPPTRSADEPSFLMYTSGTCGSPKGVRTTLSNLAHQVAMNREAVESGPDSVSCWWAPHYHDFGLISGFFNVLYAGATGVCFSPLDFVGRPALWLDALHSYRATHTFAPDFGYQQVLRKTTAEQRAAGTWDLSCLRVAMNAAEKIRATTLNQFAAAFAPCGFRWEMFCPAYGLAEHTVGVTINGPRHAPQLLRVNRRALEAHGQVQVLATGRDAARERPGSAAVTLVGCGSARAGTDVQIVALNGDGDPACDART